MVSPAASFYSAWRLLTGPSDSKRRKRHALGAILGVAFSIVPLIVVQQVSSGMIEGISRRFLEIGSFHLQAKQFIKEERGITETAELLSEIEGVTLAMPVVEGLGIAYSADGRNGVTVRGLPGYWLENDPWAASYLQWDEGRFTLEERDHLLISREAARILNISVGDQITLLTAFEQPGRGTMMKPSRFIVQGIFSTGYYELDTLTVYISYERAVVLFPDLWSGSVAVKITDPFGNHDSMQKELAGKLGPGWRVYTWYDLQRPMFESFKTTRTLLVFIMVLIVLIASFSITSAVVMMVMEHEQEIAMLKSTGVNSATIERLFLILGFFIGASGVIIGVSTGLVISININTIISTMEWFLGTARYWIMRPFTGWTGPDDHRLLLLNPEYYLEKIPVVISLTDIGSAALFALFAALLGSWLPAKRAGRLKPLDIFRKH